MSRALLVINSFHDQAQAIRWIEKAPRGTRITFQGPRRSLDQNARFWAMLTEIATQKTHHGIKLSPDDWRLLFLDALKREVRMVPNLDGNGFVSLGRSSSDLSKAEFSDLFDVIEAWAAREGVTFSHQPSEADRDGSEPKKLLPVGA